MMITFYRKSIERLRKLAWVGPLLARLAVGIVFVQTGWGKLHDLASVTAFFTELGIPAPGFNAALVATTEFAGGLLLVLGLGTRLAAAPLAGTMVVAILTAKRAEIDGLGTLLGFEETLYLIAFLWLLVAGPAQASIDHLIRRRVEKTA
jgi:putative oxidoreductase